LRVQGGEILLIDESYNANPASMAATLRSLGALANAQRRIAVLGPMRELGEHSEAMHAGLAPAVRRAKVDKLILIGAEMQPLAAEVEGEIAVEQAADVDDATERLVKFAQPGDAVLVKASNSVGLARLVKHVVEAAACST
jgi:UDP-N-acetylmuramyl pentapeptide synthase